MNSFHEVDPIMKGEVNFFDVKIAVYIRVTSVKKLKGLPRNNGFSWLKSVKMNAYYLICLSHLLFPMFRFSGA